ncbi:YgaP family membrane protein [Hyphomonas johnsonii]|jgi:EamA domain-containing membrane protein RarD|uniref:Inner membrane protein YgaP-like transmembrane domain-containing protein n=1 Tax=Hyphomonas johnsonii MHS-2 TaxID=1280950 RepID=A0A059FRU7_9PROT|nr:DUF2892 domain-containing protein [Hyphomonas johnsonii]KCZ93389.1 hypothetical protein HJO_06020 [Hyphomonas johnsonii MHS-2]
MNLDRAIFAFAGTVVLLSLALGYWIHPAFYLLNAFAGLNLLQSAFTGFCPAAVIFKWAGVKSGSAFH